MSAATVVATATHRRPTRVQRTRTRKTSARLEIVALLAIMVLLGVGMWLTTSGGHPTVGSARVRVEAGQTIWSLAKSHPVKGFSTEQTARLIASLNRVHGGQSLAAGSVVRVPAPVDAPNQGVALAMR